MVQGVVLSVFRDLRGGYLEEAVAREAEKDGEYVTDCYGEGAATIRAQDVIFLWVSETKSESRLRLGFHHN